MKKEYNKPTVEVVDLANNILAGSELGVSNNPGDGSESLAKRGYSFDDEEETAGEW